jgi:hypothetical protein
MLGASRSMFVVDVVNISYIISLILFPQARSIERSPEGILILNLALVKSQDHVHVRQLVLERNWRESSLKTLMTHKAQILGSTVDP